MKTFLDFSPYNAREPSGSRSKRQSKWLEKRFKKILFLFEWKKKDMDIFDDMGASKLSSKVYLFSL